MLTKVSKPIQIRESQHINQTEETS